MWCSRSYDQWGCDAVGHTQCGAVGHTVSVQHGRRAVGVIHYYRWQKSYTMLDQGAEGVDVLLHSLLQCPRGKCLGGSVPLNDSLCMHTPASSHICM